MKKALLLSIVTLAIGASAFAGPRGHMRPQRDYGDGVIVGILASSAALFASQTTADNRRAVYMYADNDAAAFLAGEEKTPVLDAAMRTERSFLAENQIQGSESLSDQDIAFMVMKRAESMQ